MQSRSLRSSVQGLTVGGLTLLTACVSAPPPPPPPTYAPVVVQPAPVVVETVAVPSSYVIVDGEYIGFVGNQYYYLAPGCVWVVCDPIHLARFHHWERDHRDWRAHVIPNDRYRRDALGHEHPRPDDRRVVRPSHSDPRLQPSHGGQSVQPGRSVAPRAQPNPAVQRVQPQPNPAVQRMQPGHETSRAVQPPQAHAGQVRGPAKKSDQSPDAR